MNQLRWGNAVRMLPRTEWLLLCIFAVGIFLRMFQFPNLPPGLFVDEAGTEYEAFSLLRTGADRFDVHLPVYFISWGSGQNVLYSYLSIPFIAVLGLSRFSVRLLSLFVGILTLPLLYVTVKRTLGKRAALVSVLLLALMPWHVMISRWALECNLLPFFLLLGKYTVSRALSTERSRVGTLIAFLPWGLSLYAYATAYIIVPILLVLVLLFYRQVILENWKAWFFAYVLFLLLAFPLVLFLFKNNVTRDVLALEQFLPLGIPLLRSAVPPRFPALCRSNWKTICFS